MNSHWKDRCWSSSILVTWYEELIRWKSPRCWERLRAEGEEGVRGWDGWMAYWCNRHEIGQPSGVVEGQAGLACCSPWGHKELDTTVWLSNNNDKRDWKYSVYERLGQTTLIPKTNLKTTGGICKKVSFWKFWADQNWIGYSLRKCIQGLVTLWGSVSKALQSKSEQCVKRWDLCLRWHWLNELQVASLYSFILWLEDLAVGNLGTKGSALGTMCSAYSIFKHLQPLKTLQGFVLLRMLLMCLLSYPLLFRKIITNHLVFFSSG